MYHLKIFLNGETYETDTDNVGESLLSFKPEQLYTEVYVTVSDEFAVRERRLKLIQARRVFNDPVALEVFLINLFL